MKIRVSNNLEVFNPTLELISWCNSHLVLDNPEYHKKVQMGFSTYNTPRKIYLFEVRGDVYILPFGCLSILWNRYKEVFEFENDIKPMKSYNYQSAIEPYEYQEEAIKKALYYKNGIIVMPTGSGKTQTALEVIARLNTKALWLTHTQDLLNQSKDRAKSVFGCDNSAFGTITGGKVNISNGITFATVQTMAKIDLPQYKDEWGAIIVDECHHAAGSATKVTQFYKVLNNLSARYKIGITATPKRADGLTDSMFALLGNTIHTVSKEAVKHTTCDVNVEPISTNYAPEDKFSICRADGTIDYNKLVTQLISDDMRFMRIMHEINSREGSMIVLANRVEYLERMNEAYEGRSMCLSGMTASKKNKLARKKALKDLQNGELDCIFATYSLASEGLDCPSLRYVVFATPEKDERIVSQAVGRVTRKFEGKPFGTVIDFVDDFGVYKGYWTKRKKIYKKLECNIIE